MRADQKLPEADALCPPSVLRNDSAARLRSAFKRALSVAFASSLGAWGCGADGTNAVELPCDLQSRLPLDAIEPAKPVDFVAAHRITQTGPNAPIVRAMAGEPCATAKDRDACAEELVRTVEGLDLAPSCGDVKGPCRDYYVTTSGDAVERYTSRAELAQFLGAIDTPADALVLLDFDQLTRECGDGTTLAESERGFELSRSFIYESCPLRNERITWRVAADGTLTEVGREPLPFDKKAGCAVEGRRPEGLRSERLLANDSALGAYLARAAYYEAASVVAFEILARELAHHGAPKDLVRRARLAARDEVRHAALTAAQAYRFGACPQVPEVAARPLRSLYDIALDNATEGAVRETYAALLASHQAQTAREPSIRALMTQIARDELLHAALAFDIDAWIRPQLDEAARARVAVAQTSAVESLARDCVHERIGAQRELAGLPDAAGALQLCGVLREQLWQA